MDENTKHEVHEEEEEKKDINGWLLFFIVMVILAAYFTYEWYAVTNGETPECAYTDRGCQGYNNRWGI